MPPAPAPTHDVASDGSLCLPFVRDLGVSGASISVVGFGGRQSSICSSGAFAARADALQFDLGEGPRWEALSSRTPVLCPDLTGSENTSWPIFLAAARELGVHAVFSFPMLMGAALVGVVDLYSVATVTSDPAFVAQAKLLTGRVASAAVQKALHSAEDHRSDESILAPSLRREVHQATGMIISQLDVSASEAFSRLQGYAFATGATLQDVAHKVVARTIDFARLPD
ncbi:GAF and ANTAR domain-containing protein [Subtercola sp. PAMC28395]|uniref:GAF and ANTAR domain-containing protein n=1 Tax=Subtercola sp. PAMC28395 TaxID=2846775 RepID=UPI001C0D917E|nr:GAF and ANTAR domain-containing protein [Subtercola sp. PAMC28395]QWT24486.1 GAF and ANTAR domain-containing protein [Subtercola sp. PAMC28395]